MSIIDKLASWYISPVGIMSRHRGVMLNLIVCKVLSECQRKAALKFIIIIQFTFRYYLKNNMETETLCSDEDAQELLRESQISLLQLSTIEVATQLSMRDFELFRNIEPTEYIDDLYKMDSKTGNAHLKQFEDVINQETFWVATEILTEPNQLKRMKIVKHFIKIALHCRECKNFNSMFAVIR